MKLYNNSKIILDYWELAKVVQAHKTLKHRIICTIWSWDLLHIWHLRYLNQAKSRGDILVVWADSDRSIKLYKNKFRPIIPEDERLEMLSYQSCVDYVTLIDDIDEKWDWHYELIRIIEPDEFICVKDSYPEQQVKDIKRFVTTLTELRRQAENTSTTWTIEKTLKTHMVEVNDFLNKNNEQNKSK